jgi:hypothetical protein
MRKCGLAMPLNCLACESKLGHCLDESRQIIGRE